MIRRALQRETRAVVVGGREPIPGAWSLPVTEDQAMRESVVFACVSLIAETIAALPVDAVRVRAGRRERLDPTPAILDAPSGMLDRVEWIRSLVESWLLRGAAAAWVVASDRGQPTQAELLPCDQVRLEERPGRPPRFFVAGEEVAIWPNGRLLWWPVLVKPPSIRGRSVLEFAADTVGLSVMASRFSRRFFARDAHPTAAVMMKDRLNREQLQELKARMRAAVEDGGPVILSGGAEMQTLQISPRDAAFLDAIAASGVMIARFFRVPPEMVGLASQSSGSLVYANVESRARSLLTFSLRPWIVRLERALSQLLPRGQNARVVVDALLSVDSRTRAAVYAEALRSGWMTIDEIRALEDRPPMQVQQVLEQQAAEAMIGVQDAQTTD